MYPVRAGSYWDRLGPSLKNLGPPLCPSNEDIRFMEETVASWQASRRVKRIEALLLGVTPEIAGMRWPEESSLMAVDRSLPMIDAVWVGNAPGRRAAVCGNWLAPPRRDSSCHVVIGDGSINSLAFPEGLQSLGETVSRLLRDDGLLVMRCFVQTVPPESPDRIYADLQRGAIGSFHACKLRLLMAMQNSPEEGVAVREVFESWVDRNMDPHSLPSKAGFERAAIDTIDFYRDASTVYTFPTLAQLRSVLGVFFREMTISIPGYELGERCPTLALTPRRGAADPA